VIDHTISATGIKALSFQEICRQMNAESGRFLRGAEYPNVDEMATKPF
jgi:hypothetical protein